MIYRIAAGRGFYVDASGGIWRLNEPDKNVAYIDFFGQCHLFSPACGPLLPKWYEQAIGFAKQVVSQMDNVS